MKALIREIKYQYHAWRFNRLRARQVRKLAPRLTHQRGFTLIELMIVVLIVGILAAIALPAYAQYTVKAAGSEAVRMLDGAEAAVAESYFSNGVAPGNAAEAGISQGAGKYVQSMNVGTNGTIWATFLPTAPGGLANQTLQMTPYLSGADPSSPLVWTCGLATAAAGWVALTSVTANAPPGTTVPAALLPRVCRPGG